MRSRARSLGRLLTARWSTSPDGAARRRPRGVLRLVAGIVAGAVACADGPATTAPPGARDGRARPAQGPAASLTPATVNARITLSFSVVQSMPMRLRQPIMVIAAGQPTDATTTDLTPDTMRTRLVIAQNADGGLPVGFLTESPVDPTGPDAFEPRTISEVGAVPDSGGMLSTAVGLGGIADPRLAGFPVDAAVRLAPVGSVLNLPALPPASDWGGALDRWPARRLRLASDTLWHERTRSADADDVVEVDRAYRVRRDVATGVWGAELVYQLTRVQMTLPRGGPAGEATIRATVTARSGGNPALNPRLRPVLSAPQLVPCDYEVTDPASAGAAPLLGGTACDPPLPPPPTTPPPTSPSPTPPSPTPPPVTGPSTLPFLATRADFVGFNCQMLSFCPSQDILTVPPICDYWPRWMSWCIPRFSPGLVMNPLPTYQYRGVLYQHGIMSDKTTWNFMRVWIGETYPKALHWAYTLSSLKHLAVQAADLQDSMRLPPVGPAYGLDKWSNWVVVGHSQGGLIGRAAYAKPPAGSGPIRGLITIGSPHLGAPLAGRLLPAGGYVIDYVNKFIRVYGCPAAGFGTPGYWACTRAADAGQFGGKLSEMANGGAAEDLVPGSVFLAGLANTVTSERGPRVAVEVQTAPRWALFRLTADGRLDCNPAPDCTGATAVRQVETTYRDLRTCALRWWWSWRTSLRCTEGYVVLDRMDKMWHRLVGSADGTSDAVVPGPSQRYPGADRLYQLTAGPSHIGETREPRVRDVIDFELWSRMGMSDLRRTDVAPPGSGGP